MATLINIPEGTRDRLFAECRDRRRTRDSLTGLFRRRGYAEISTPEVEFYDLFLQSGNPLPQEAMLKIIDRSGKIMVMRPDCTTPIARVAATRLRVAPLPQRLYYDQTVFRSGQEHKGGSGEIAQCGVELIGGAGERADLEMIALAVDALRESGLEQFHIELGHAGFFRSLVGRMDMDGETVERVRTLIEGKNFAALNDLLEPYAAKPACAALGRLSRLFGGEEVLDEAEDLAGEDGALRYLRDLYRSLAAAGYSKWIRFDLGLVHQIDYYTGVVFRGYMAGAGAAVLSGGRYDGLTAAFGRSAPATGFAIDVDAVAGCLEGGEMPGLELLVYFTPDRLAQALATVDSRAPGTCELSPCATPEETLTLAQEKGCSAILVLDGGEERLVTV